MKLAVCSVGVLALTLCGCLATTADVREMADTIDAMQMGIITQEEAVAELDAKATDIEARSLKVPTSLPEALVQLLTIGGALGGTAYASKRMVNRDRDAKRTARGEKV